MVIDTLFKSESGKLYVGSDDGNGKFTGKSISGGELSSKTYVGINGTLVAKFVTPFEHAGKTAPLHHDIKVEGAGTAFGLGQYLTSLTRARQRNADGGSDGNDGGDA